MNQPLPNKLVKYLASAILIVVAAIQFYLSKELHVSPWKGGGFGMFSTVNSTNSYFFRAYSFIPDSSEKFWVIIPAKYLSEEDHVRHYPFKNDLQELRSSLLKEKWVILNREIINSEADISHSGTPMVITDIDLEMWQYKFDAQTSRVYSCLLLKL